MSVVVALAVPEHKLTVLGCDQRAGAHMVPTKWAFHGQWAIGVSGVYRAFQLVERGSMPQVSDAFEVATWTRDLLAEDGFAPFDNPGGSQTFDTSILIARPGRVWAVDSSASPIEVPGGQLAAVGSGREFALGAARVLAWREFSHAELVREALEAAIALEWESCGGEPLVRVWAGAKERTGRE